MGSLPLFTNSNKKSMQINHNLYNIISLNLKLFLLNTISFLWSHAPYYLCILVIFSILSFLITPKSLFHDVRSEHSNTGYKPLSITPTKFHNTNSSNPDFRIYQNKNGLNLLPYSVNHRCFGEPPFLQSTSISNATILTFPSHLCAFQIFISIKLECIERRQMHHTCKRDSFNQPYHAFSV